MATLLILLAVMLIRSNRQKQKINLILDEKVKERTKQLEDSHEALVWAAAERNILIERTSVDMKSSLASIKGLCEIGMQDIADPDARQYILKVGSIFE